MSKRPCFVIWMRPVKTGGEWDDPPLSLRLRWEAEGAAGPGLVFWEKPGSRMEPASVGDLLGEGLAQAARTQGVDIGLSVLFVWDGLDADRSFIKGCLLATSKICCAFRQSIDANAGVYPQLTGSRFEILIRLPNVGRTTATPDAQARWLNRVEELVRPATGARAAISRVWLLSGNNVDVERHPKGITEVEPERLDQLIAESIILWLEEDIGKALSGAELPGKSAPFGSFGLGRLVFEAAEAQRFCSAKKAVVVLGNLLTSGGRVPPAQDSTRFLEAELELAPGIRSLNAAGVLQLFFQPARLTTTRPGDSLQDLKQIVSMALRPLPYDMEAVPLERTLTTPAELMLQANMMLANDLTRAGQEVIACRSRLFRHACIQLFERAGRFLSSGEDIALEQTETRLSAWKTWLEDERSRIDGVVQSAFKHGPEPRSPLAALVAEIFAREDDPSALVPEDDPDPQKYCAQLSDLISRRPLTGSYMSRSFLAALIGGQAAAIAVDELQPVLPFLLNVPLAGSPWIVAGIVTTCWLALSVLHLASLRKRRRLALRALYIAVVRRGRNLLRKFLRQQMHELFDDLITFVGDPDDAKGNMTNLQRLGARLEEMGKSDEATQEACARTLFSRLARLREIVEAAKEPLGKAALAQRIAGSSWVLPLAAGQSGSEFPFLAGRVETIRQEDEPALEDIIQRLIRETGALGDAWKACTTDSDEAAVSLRASAVEWMAATGFAYITNLPVARVMDFLSRRKPGLQSEWKQFMERSAHPYLSLRSEPLVSVGIVHPAGENALLNQVLEQYPVRPSGKWSGAAGVVAYRVHGPATAGQVPLLPLDFPEEEQEETEQKVQPV